MKSIHVSLDVDCSENVCGAAVTCIDSRSVLDLASDEAVWSHVGNRDGARICQGPS